MLYNDVKRIFRATPFVPVEIVVSGGERYLVHRPEHVLVTSREIGIGVPSPRDPQDYPEAMAFRGLELVEAITPIRQPMAGDTQG